jgi:hypothetical protein
MGNDSKQRKSESQERFEEADNAGRFAGNDTDAQAAKQEAIDNIREDSGSSRDERDQQTTDAEAGRDPGQTHDYKGEAQNVNDDEGRPLDNGDTEKARNKATEGLRQGREDS